MRKHIQELGINGRRDYSEMIRIIIGLVIVMSISSPAFANGLSGACMSKGITYGNPNKIGAKTQTSTDKYRFEDGKVFHSWEGRDEYEYGPVTETQHPNSYTSGLMRFVFTSDQGGYATHADNIGWKVIHLDCAISR